MILRALALISDYYHGVRTTWVYLLPKNILPIAIPLSVLQPIDNM